ncbi:MAG: ABC transporter permease [Rhodoglobus sp.]
MTSALTSIPKSETAIDVQVVRQTVPLSAGSSLIKKVIARQLGNSVQYSTSSVAMSEPEFVPDIQDHQLLTYFGEYDNFQSNTELVAGEWPEKWSGGAAAIPVALPETAAKALDLTLGSSFQIRNYQTALTATVVGLYSVTTPNGDYWARDRLNGNGNGTGNDSRYFGPLIAAPGTIDAAKLSIASLDINFTPNFASVAVDQLDPLLRRLSAAKVDIPKELESIAPTIFYSSKISGAVLGVASGLVVTRSTVIVVSLLLLVLAVAVLGQTARAFNDARAGERQLLRARGASVGNILALSTLEAAVIGVITAAVSPPLSMLVYRILAAQPAMVAAHMPTDAGIPGAIWLTAAGVSLVFVVVLIAPLLRRSRSIVESDQTKGRQRGATGFMRSGLDIAFVVLAGVAYWQLVSYRSPVNTSGSLGIDPVLVAGPALMLVAGALLSVRLIPPVSKVIVRFGSRARGSVIPLASWEIGRRSQRATAAVLLLSLTLAVGTFGLSFLATWKQSQLDQASLAVGPPVRISASVPPDPSVQATLLAKDTLGTPQPALRRMGQLESSGSSSISGASTSGTDVTVLGLTARARKMIDQGRLAQLGGAKIVSLLTSQLSPATGVTLPGAVNGVSATIQVKADPEALPGVAANVRAILEDGNGLLTTVSMGSVRANDTPQQVHGVVQLPADSSGLVAPVRFVGFQTTFAVVDTVSTATAEANANVLVKDLAVLHVSSSQKSSTVTYASQPVTVDATAGWSGVSADPAGPLPTVVTAASDWQFDLGVDVPAGLKLSPATFTLVGWSPVAVVPAVIPSALAETLNVKPHAAMVLDLQQVPVNILVAGTVAHVPGTANSDALSKPNSGFAASSGNPNIVVLDQEVLQRSLAQSGVQGPMVDEWWVDVPVGQGQAYLNRVKNPAGALSSEVFGLQLEQAPLRVATQAALWLAIVAGGLLAAVGFAVHSATMLRSRRLELAQLRAIGLSRNKLVGAITVESLFISLLGAVFGIAIGVLLMVLVGPLVAVSPDGLPPVPSVAVQIPWSSIGLLIVGLAAVLAIIVFAIARIQRSVEPAELLRGGTEL